MIRIFKVEFKSKVNRQYVGYGNGVVVGVDEPNGDISFYGMDVDYKYQSKLLKVDNNVDAHTTTDIFVEKHSGSHNIPATSIIGDVDKFVITDVSGGHSEYAFTYNGVVKGNPEMKIEIKGKAIFNI